MYDLELYNEFIRTKMQTLSIILGKDCTVDGCWLGQVEGVHIEGVKDRYLQCRLDILIDEDGLDRLKEYAMIETVMGSHNGEHNDGNKSNNENG